MLLSRWIACLLLQLERNRVAVLTMGGVSANGWYPHYQIWTGLWGSLARQPVSSLTGPITFEYRWFFVWTSACCCCFSCLFFSPSARDAWLHFSVEISQFIKLFSKKTKLEQKSVDSSLMDGESVLEFFLHILKGWTSLLSASSEFLFELNGSLHFLPSYSRLWHHLQSSRRDISQSGQCCPPRSERNRLKNEGDAGG